MDECEPLRSGTLPTPLVVGLGASCKAGAYTRQIFSST